MKQPQFPHTPQATDPAQSSLALQEQRLDAFWRKALAAAPDAPIDASKLATARAAIFAAAELHSGMPSRHARSPWHWLRSWGASGSRGFAPPRWATGLASITLASLVLVLWYGRMPEPSWDFDTAGVMPAATPNAAASPAPTPAPALPDQALAGQDAEPRARASARQAPAAQWESAPNAAMAQAAPARKAAPSAHGLAPPAPAPIQRQREPSSSVTVYGQSDLALAPANETSRALQAQLLSATGGSWRASAQSLFRPLNDAQSQALVQLLLPLAQQAHSALAAGQSGSASALSLLQRQSQQVLLKQWGEVRLIVHIVATPHYHIDWLSPNNAWLASTSISEAAYNRITTMLHSPIPTTPSSR